jgi:hypothetical protein
MIAARVVRTAGRRPFQIHVKVMVEMLRTENLQCVFFRAPRMREASQTRIVICNTVCYLTFRENAHVHQCRSQGIPDLDAPSGG